MKSASLARVAGAIYLILIISGIFGLVYMPATLIDWSNPTATVTQIKSQEMFFRLGVLADAICFVCFIFLPLVLYKLLAWVNREVAILMVILALISIPVTLVNMVKLVDVLTLLAGHSYLAAIDGAQLEAQVMYLLVSFNNNTLIANIFWGAWLFPFGYLVMGSGILPRVLGILLILGGLGYLAEFIMKFMFSQESVPFWIGLPGTLGEFGICLWLIVMGAKEAPVSTQNTSG
ncbi:DUF4386 domain-containing protein [Cellvibrio sp. OA-2007]|uniref:DUF4386 domain-containing protein n=1 Tax=Cellvibrio sp. OA-2007 TaxID=529823 RepID=UPI0007825AE4|nr:DUF4386 domain-containing protein [Cellvibrio sp. OA-2007]